MQPFTINFSQAEIDTIRSRVKAFPWHEMPDDGGWAYGTNLDYLRELCDYWVNHFDWFAEQDALNQLAHFKAQADGINLHFIHENGIGPKPLPLLISHGWPGSVAEFRKIIGPLTNPAQFGGDPQDAFDVIAPSLPGFGFSGKPNRPIGPRRMAKIFNSLMTDVLGYPNYLAQGGDWGGAISSWLGFDHAPPCMGIHINILTMRHADGPRGAEEIAWAQQFEIDQAEQDGYRTIQATKPQTLSYAMMDSPVGIAAWITEKFHAWSDLEEGVLESVYTKDELLTNIMIYILTRTFNTASWIYYGRREEGGRIMSADHRRVEVPTAAALFPEELLAWPPRSYVERLYNITQWTEMPRGGHFAAMEAPALLIEDIRKFARRFR
ncbi:MAG: epoxide hydrolase [Gammaproteobacteria bacterium]